MKNIYTYLALSLILLSSCSSSRDFAQGYTPDQPQDVTYQTFYDDLSPYGNWVNYQDYGYVWVPNEQGFRPYYNNGQWVYTNYGWTWVSSYNWGWAPFHYGRWFYDDGYGWMWTPGYEWAPAWVSWRSGNGCYGWAPLGPGNNFDMGRGSRIPDNYWAFVPNRYINSPRINNYYINKEKNVTIINNSTVINNTTIINNNNSTNKTGYVGGPSAPEVEKVTNQKIRTVRITQQNAPGNSKVSGSTVSIYKPGVRQMPQQNDQAKPSRVVDLNDLRTNRQNVINNRTPANNGQGNTAPVNSNTRPVINPQRGNNNVPVINDNSNNNVNKNQGQFQQHPQPQPQQQAPPATQQNQADNHQPQLPVRQNPVNNGQQPQVQSQQPQRALPGNRVPDANNTDKNNEQRDRNFQPRQNPVIQQPVITNEQPAKVRVMRQPDRNPDNNQQNANVQPSAPVNRQPARAEQPNIIRPQHFPVPDNNQPTIAPVNRAPVFREQNSGESREIRREAPQREQK